jgi:hypothetical protein
MPRHTLLIDASRDRLLQRLDDEHQIRRRLYEYCRGVDRCDSALIASVYHVDGTDDHGSFVGLGSEFAVHVVRRMLESHDASMHTLGNILIDFVDDGTGPVDVAHVEAYVHAEHRRHDDDGAFLERFAGRYVDRFERRDGVWRIAHRTLLHEWDARERVTPAFTPGRYRSGIRGADDPSYRST